MGIKYFILLYNKPLEPATRTTAALILPSFLAITLLRAPVSKEPSSSNHFGATLSNTLLCTIVSFKWTSDRLIASCTMYEFVFHFLKLSPPLCIIDLDLAYSSNAFFSSRIPDGMFERVSLPPKIHVKRKHCKMKRAKLTPKAKTGQTGTI